MATDYLEYLLIRQMANYATSSTAKSQRDNATDSDDVFDAFKRKINEQVDHYTNVLQDAFMANIGAVVQRRRRKSSPRSEREKHKQNGTNGVIQTSEENHIEMSHFDGLGVNSTQKIELGKGHDFESLVIANPTWCDKCSEFIGFTQSLRCRNCQYTCHQKCRELVTLDCRASPDRKSPEKSSSNTEETSLNGDGTKEKSPLHVDEDHFAFYSTARESLPGMRPIPLRPDPSLSTQSNKIEDDNDSGYATAKETLPGMPEPLIRQPSADTLTREDLRRRIDQFNRNKHGLQIEMHEGETNKNTFRGVIRVHMSLIRPINMSLAERPPSIYEVLTHELENEADMNTAERRKNRTTSFYLPKDTMKALHIDSDTTTREVITTLLSKFKITDNPRKFVLYEHTLEIDDKKVIVRKLHDDEQPLKLYLDWSEEILNRKKLVLQENDSGEIQWDAFSLPELNNFLRILELEEREYKEQLKAKFQLLRLQMQMRHKELTQLKREQDRQVFV
ncbi:unnamed protein product [Owenia fusiformis]|uniref:Ras association domain-containing protein 1 n=1 Tax=Owenia fusiformis TaxID=6347 RepID=A0A8S4NQG5_OWEFU|nr:unnamed protein product [Owenia fusiformis]